MPGQLDLASTAVVRCVESDAAPGPVDSRRCRVNQSALGAPGYELRGVPVLVERPECAVVEGDVSKGAHSGNLFVDFAQLLRMFVILVKDCSSYQMLCNARHARLAVVHPNVPHADPGTLTPAGYNYKKTSDTYTHPYAPFHQNHQYRVTLLRRRPQAYAREKLSAV